MTLISGRVSDWYGLKNDSRHQSWSKSGHPLIGFDGAADDVVKGLRVCTVFSRILIGVTNKTLASLGNAAEHC